MWSLKIHGSGGIYFCEIYLLELYQVLTVIIRGGKNVTPLCFQQREGEKNHFEISQNTLLFLAGPALKRNCLTRA